MAAPTADTATVEPPAKRRRKFATSGVRRHYLARPALTSAQATATKVLKHLQQTYEVQTAEGEFQGLKDTGLDLQDITEVVDAAREQFRQEPVIQRVETDAWVLGDIHGNFRDLFFFYKELIPFDVGLCPFRLVCLGDYVDRGPFGLECVLLLFCLKLLSPPTVVLLRGNHEDPLVCGDLSQYGEGSFLYQCKHVLGTDNGQAFFEDVCQAFAHLPLCAIIDKRIFCAHGGIPRFYREGDADDLAAPFYDRLALLEDESFPRYVSLFGADTAAEINQTEGLEKKLKSRQWLGTYDILWSDPVRDPTTELDDDGFGPSERGGNSVAFSVRAVNTFLSSFNFDMMIRAHQEKRSGLHISQSAKVITVFSSSNYQGHGNGAGVVLIRKNGKVDLIMKTGADA